jgi:hypothetical protein
MPALDHFSIIYVSIFVVTLHRCDAAPATFLDARMKITAERENRARRLLDASSWRARRFKLNGMHSFPIRGN